MIIEPLFVYVNKTGDVRVETLDSSRTAHESDEWKLIASLEPRTYLQKILNENANLVADMTNHN